LVPETPVEETREALHDVVKAGKARYLGASSMRAWRFAKMQHVAESNGFAGRSGCRCHPVDLFLTDRAGHPHRQVRRIRHHRRLATATGQGQRRRSRQPAVEHDAGRHRRGTGRRRGTRRVIGRVHEPREQAYLTDCHRADDPLGSRCLWHIYGTRRSQVDLRTVQRRSDLQVRRIRPRGCPLAAQRFAAPGRGEFLGGCPGGEQGECVGGG